MVPFYLRYYNIKTSHIYICEKATHKAGGAYPDGGTIRKNCVNLSDATFRFKVCVHSPDAHFQRGVRLCHTLAQFLRLVGVNAASGRVYQARKIQTRNIHCLIDGFINKCKCAKFEYCNFTIRCIIASGVPVHNFFVRITKFYGTFSPI